jgi:hypothetical protein
MILIYKIFGEIGCTICNDGNFVWHSGEIVTGMDVCDNSLHTQPLASLARQVGGGPLAGGALRE